MHTFFAVVLTAVVTFAVTNIDDIFVLILFFSQTDATFRPRHVVIGQYLGFVSAPIVPDYIIGLLGLAPITLGIRRLLRLRCDAQDEEKTPDLHAAPRRRIGFLPPQTLAVASVTIANGGIISAHTSRSSLPNRSLACRSSS